MTRIYLDHSATTPVDERVVVAMNECMLDKFGNASSVHSFGRTARAALDKARIQVADLLNATTDNLYFTSGGTEADNLALIGVCQMLRDKGDHLVISQIEHPAIMNAATELERLGYRVTRVAAGRDGIIDPKAVADAIESRTILVSVMHVNNEVGSINDIAAIAEIAHSRGVLFHTDAVQSFGKLALDVKRMGIDLLSLSGHKIYGPKGIGALYIRSGVDLAPRQFGGHQEAGIRPGTENMPGIVGFGVAAAICQEEMENEAQKLTELRDELYGRLVEELDDVVLNGHPTERLPGNLNVSLLGVEGDSLLQALDLEGIAVSTGSACSSGSTKPSHVLTAIGLSNEEAHSSLRLTLGRGNSMQDIIYAARVIADQVTRLREIAGVTPRRSRGIASRSGSSVE